MAKFTVIFDACILYPAVVRDSAMRLAMTGLFKAHWTDQIHDEWINGLKREKDEDGNQRIPDHVLLRTRELMDAHVYDAKVENYEHLIEHIQLPDPNDRHVVAAAIKANADAIVTYNLKDFPADYLLQNFNLEVIHPDDFFRYQFDLNPAVAIAAFKSQWLSLKHPPLTREDFLLKLKTNQLIQTAGFLEGYL